MPRNNNVDIKSFDELSVEEATKKVQDKLFRERKKAIKELGEYERNEKNKNFDHEKKLILAYSKERKETERELIEYYNELQRISLHEYATLLGKADKDAIEEHKKLLTMANREAVSRGIKEGFKKAGININNKFGLDITLDTGALAKATDNIVKRAADVFSRYQGKINTRLIGYVENSNNAFKKIVDANAKTSPYYKTTEYLQNVNQLVEAGIVQNLEQRAFLATVKDEVVNTFNATNETLTRLVRIQNQDSTAARAGMEAYLNAFLNKNFENSEYLTKEFSNISSSLEEAMALLGAEQATNLEYVVQKWLGALYSEGMSSGGVRTLASAIGQLASGNIDDLIGTNAGNLIAMASKGNLATYFKDGLTEATADILMQSIVSYLQELNSSGNNVVRSQLAKVFGLSISDLRAASNVNVGALAGNNLGYSEARGYLGDLLGTAHARMSMVEKMDNVGENLLFNLGANIAGNWFSYFIYKMADMIEPLLGGGKFTLKTPIPGVSISTSASDIMKMGVLGGSVIDLIGQSIFTNATFGIGSTLERVYNSLGGLSKSDKILSSGVGLRGTGSSESGYIGNSSTSNIFGSSLSGMRNLLSDNRAVLTGKESDEDALEVVVPNIYKYLINTLDVKLDTLIKLSSINANYSVIDSLGNNLTNNMNTIMGGNQVVVRANPVDDRVDVVNSISESVLGIYGLLQKVISGELQVAVRDISNINGLAMNTMNRVWTGAVRQ